MRRTNRRNHPKTFCNGRKCGDSTAIRSSIALTTSQDPSPAFGHLGAATCVGRPTTTPRGQITPTTFKPCEQPQNLLRSARKKMQSQRNNQRRARSSCRHWKGVVTLAVLADGKGRSIARDRATETPIKAATLCWKTPFLTAISGDRVGFRIEDVWIPI